MNRRIISSLLVFLLFTSVTFPVAAAAEAPQVYYELHNLCLCGAHEDLGKIPYLTFGIGYEGRVIDDVKDKWILFIHAGAATKKIIITPETPTQKLILIRDFVNAVDECKEESEQVPSNLLASIGLGIPGCYSVLKGTVTDDSLKIMIGGAGITASIEEIHQFVLHLNAAKNAQKNAEKLFNGVSP